MRIADRVYHRWQVYRPEEAVADHRSRVSLLGRFITPRRRMRIIDRVYHSWQVYHPEEAVADHRSRVWAQGRYGRHKIQGAKELPFRKRGGEAGFFPNAGRVDSRYVRYVIAGGVDCARKNSGGLGATPRNPAL